MLTLIPLLLAAMGHAGAGEAVKVNRTRLAGEGVGQDPEDLIRSEGA